jgi:hypothetical protein
MLILLWGVGSDGPLAAVLQELQRLGVPTSVIDQRHVLSTEIDLEVGSGMSGAVRTPHGRIDLGTVTAFYLRPYDSRCLPVIAQEGPNSAAWRHALRVDDILASWSQITPAVVVNPLGAMAVNGSKPYQLRQIRRLGFSVPETLVTTDPNTAHAFWQQHGTVIYKSVSAVRSRVARLQPEDVRRLGDVSSCPTQFQQYITGRDYRVHVVGSEIFASEVICEADDYRYPAEHTVEIRACRLPQDVADRCRLLATAMQLAVAGIDLRQNVDGDWYCFEVNPSPAFTYYQEATDQPISRAIARLLADGSPGQRLS